MSQVRDSWDAVYARDRPSWYLDPLVAEQKRMAHLELCRRWSPGVVRRALKTDSFEEAFGEDALFPNLLTASQTWFAMDVSERIVWKAQSRAQGRVRFLAADARSLPLRSASLDLVLSNSTLDHFDSGREFDDAIREIARVLRPGGQLIITVDNPLNPLYWPVRWLSRMRWAPFPLGYTPSRSRLRLVLEAAGFEVTASATLIHNPRMLSTVVFLVLRRLLPGRAERGIRWLLAGFASLERLPTRWLTACFLAARAVRSESTAPAQGGCGRFFFRPAAR